MTARSKPGGFRERGYYMRVIARAATSCWGLVLIFGSLAPSATTAAIAREQSVPAREPSVPAAVSASDQSSTSKPNDAPASVKPADAATPAPPLAPVAPEPAAPPTAAITWSTEITAGTGLDLAATRAHIVAILRDGEEPSRLEARDLNAGKVAWTSAVRGWQRIAATETEVVGFTTDRVIAVAERDGRTLWEVPVAATPSWLTLAGGWVVATGPAETLALTRDGGTVVWRRPSPAAGGRAIVSGAELILGFEDRTLVGVDLATGATKWQQDELATAATFFGTGAGVVYVTTRGGAICAFRATTGQHMFCFEVGIPAAGPPVVVGDLVYVALFDNTVRMFDRESGAQRQPIGLAQRSVGGPLETIDGLVVPLTDAGLMRLGVPGRPVEVFAPPSEAARIRLLRVTSSADRASLALMTAAPSGAVQLALVRLPPASGSAGSAPDAAAVSDGKAAPAAP